ncbi:bifunctional metallophosphatase/5'-nucleotidase [Shewanella waksmanii]|uniref:bifunctional metallophosphatase/5'-nucleotidase n=1 Tax=Shewanella waksmanii TaxID=213783 RepID=UPI003736C935
MTTYSLSLAHINDTHSHFDPNHVQFDIQLDDKLFEVYSHSGGAARIAYQVDKARALATANQQPFLFLHGGDSFQGTLYFNQFKGKANAHLLNLLAPDAMVLGNHEIDAGNAPVCDFLDNIQFPLLAGNMDLSAESPHKSHQLANHSNLYDFDATQGIAKYILKPFHDKQLAIIGITLDQMKLIARPDEDTEFVDAIEATRNTIAHLHQQGIYHIIVLSHLGLIQDRVLAQQVDGISLIVGGHSHSLQGDFQQLGLVATPYGEMHNHTPIVQAGKYAETIGLASMEFDAQGRITKLTGSNYFMLDKAFLAESASGVSQHQHEHLAKIIAEHPNLLTDERCRKVQQVIDDHYRPAIDAMEHQVLGFIPRNLVHTRLPSKALPHGSEIAPWICKSIYHQVQRHHCKIDFVLHNAGGVRQSLNKGKLTLADVVGRILPFDLPLVKYRIKGTYLIEALESAINSATNNSVTGTGAGSFPYTYGVRYFYDGRKPIGQRIVKVEVLSHQHTDNWLTIDPNHYYHGVSSAYTTSGKEGYAPLLQACWQKTLDGVTLPSAFIAYMQEQHIDDVLSPQVNYQSHHQYNSHNE